MTRLEEDIKSLGLLLTSAHWRLDGWGVPRVIRADSTDAWVAFRYEQRETA